MIRDVNNFSGKRDCLCIEQNNQPIHYIWIANEANRGKMYYHIKNMRDTPHKFLRNSQ